MIDKAFHELMPHSVKVYHRTGLNAYGEPIYDPKPTEYRALVTPVSNWNRSNEFEVVEYSTSVYVDSTSIRPEDKIELHDGRVYVIQTIETYPDENGDYFQVIRI